jgi:hypothetical protein
LEHTRIDEGVKRGPRIMPAAPKRRRSPVARDNGKLSQANPQEVIARYFRDETTADIAQSLGVHRSALHQWLIRNCEQDWRDAQVARAITALEQAKKDTETAPDPLSLARARELLRASQWELERLFSRLYGQKQEVTHNLPQGPLVTIVLAQPQVIHNGAAQLTQGSTGITVEGESSQVDESKA